MILCVSNSTLKMYEKESMPEAGKSCLRQINLASLSRKTTTQSSRRTSLRSDELRLGRRFRLENDKSRKAVRW